MGKVSLPSYLVMIRYGYCFRLVMPVDLQQIPGLREIRYLLRTSLLIVKRSIGLMESKFKFIAPDISEANESTIHIMTAMAQCEAMRISQRTKEALATAKSRGLCTSLAG
jgi:hypothetical protein